MQPTIHGAAIFRGVEPELVAELVEDLSTTTVKAGYVVFRHGQFGDALFVIAAGKFKVGRGAPGAPDTIFTMRGTGESFGELSVFDPGPRTSTVTAIGEASVVRVDGVVMRSWIAQHPEVGDRMLRILARRLRRTEDALADLVLTDVPGRLAKQLLGLAQRFGVQENGVVAVRHGLTQEELAQLVGSSRETVNKALADFSQRGWIRLERKGMIIADSDQLVRRAR
ncbi:Crp/Fnr family transcriptional regulator [Mycobacterium yunnanensis]|uniref:Crp/Fnr family transcriptional regulator n=1 Tax=Mycobacterium yunnanensis TaxID=368477 RepID=A0A9X2YZH4_9MYCO|nr:Crp/Fnr family transcriptional regulator [Mycobacterium yunnanensis]MCV7421285.1 Crp/Fnr family transcriptional regulator [Mycobacterium yunnanensis]